MLGSWIFSYALCREWFKHAGFFEQYLKLYDADGDGARNCCSPLPPLRLCSRRYFLLFPVRACYPLLLCPGSTTVKEMEKPIEPATSIDDSEEGAPDLSGHDF